MHDWQFWSMWACGIATRFSVGWFASQWFYRSVNGAKRKEQRA